MQSSCARVGVAPQPAVFVARGHPIWTAARLVPAAAPALCSTCRVRGLCLPGAVQANDSMPVDELVLTRRRVHRGDHLFRAGDPFDALYAIRSGFFKSSAETESGRTQVTAFPMAGDLAGMDGIGSGTHVLNLVALDTGEVCVLPYPQLQNRIGLFPRLLHQVNRIMSREIVREQELMALLGTLDGEARVAAFLLSLASRFAARGWSATQLTLPMSRSETASYLGLNFATVSRIVSKLQEQGLIRKVGREVEIVNRHGLRAIARDEKERVQTEARRNLPLAADREARGQAGRVLRSCGRADADFGCKMRSA
jgi:CRP/FNR family transcriptional regulator